jgi:hypothetical protein
VEIDKERRSERRRKGEMREVEEEQRECSVNICQHTATFSTLYFKAFSTPVPSSQRSHSHSRYSALLSCAASQLSQSHGGILSTKACHNSEGINESLSYLHVY